MQVRPDSAPDATAFPAALPVVSEPRHDAAERLGAGVEPRAAGVVFEPRQRAPHAGLELALEQDVTDHPRLARHGLQREEPDAGQLDAVEVPIGASEQLVAAADGKQCGTACDRLEDALSLGGQVLGYE